MFRQLLLAILLVAASATPAFSQSLQVTAGSTHVTHLSPADKFTGTDYGKVVVGETQLLRLVMTNIEPATTVHVTTVTVTGPSVEGFVPDLVNNTVLGFNQAGILDIFLTPTTLGFRSGAVIIESDDADEPLLMFEVRAQVVSELPHAPDLGGGMDAETLKISQNKKTQLFSVSGKIELFNSTGAPCNKALLKVYFTTGTLISDSAVLVASVVTKSIVPGGKSRSVKFKGTLGPTSGGLLFARFEPIVPIHDERTWWNNLATRELDSLPF